MSSGKIAFLFPGQGSQYSGMGRSLVSAFPEAREVFDRADAVLGFSLSGLCFEGSEDVLRLTENTQPAVLTTSIAAYEVLASRGVFPDLVAGHSLGEYSALVAAGALAFGDAVQVVRNRGRYMQEAVPEGRGAMAAILGLPPDAVRAACLAVKGEQVVAPANYNSSNQIVISGHREAVERAVDEARERGARRALMLPVSAPFHCELMRAAEERLSLDLDRVSFEPLRFGLVTNVDAAVVTDAAPAREALRLQPSRPVRWQESLERLLDSGVRTFVEVGPGKVLGGLVRSIDKSVTMLNAEDEDSVNKTLAALVPL